jgi:general L-amino acid transport system substrate-binding protein
MKTGGQVMRTSTRLSVSVAAVAIAGILWAGPVNAGQTMDSVKSKGFVQCGVNTGLPGFSNADEKGHWRGIDVDVCRAVAAAVLGDATKVKFTPLTAKERFTALQSGEIDMLSRNTTWTVTRDATLGVHFAGVTYYDGQGFLVNKKLGVKSAKELDGASICVQTGTTTELNMGDYFRANKMQYTPVVFEKGDEAVAAYDSGRCDVFTSDQSQLYAQRIKLKSPKNHLVLPEVISKEPLGPVVRQGDDEWFNIVKWSLFAMVNAEEMGVNSQNVANIRKTTQDPAMKRLLGLEGDKGKDLKVSNDWVFNIVSQVGNYAESFERNVGGGSPLNIARGLNALWKDGGLQYAPPVR